MATTTEDPRVAIARDVIAQIGAARYEVEEGNYLDLFLAAPPKGSDRLGDLLDLPSSQCRACAMGAIVISRARLKNDVATGDLDGMFGRNVDADPEAVARLVEGAGFDRWNASLIEVAFERCPSFGDYSDYEGKLMAEKAANFGRRFDGPAERLVAIMANLIENGGEFRP